MVSLSNRQYLYLCSVSFSGRRRGNHLASALPTGWPFDENSVIHLLHINQPFQHFLFHYTHRPKAGAAPPPTMASCSMDPGPEKLSHIQGQVNDVKGIMSQNIEKVLERGEKLDDLIIKTDDLQASADTFQKTSTKIARKMWWKNTKMIIIIVPSRYVTAGLPSAIIKAGMPRDGRARRNKQ
ncbi:synaptobrevin-like protein 5 isoform X2 [Chiloscyllium plagiosum]|uniref:synaptobrevin-like protein 5 isoform X2 n=1 Tax=Chiloscyllium plagiosum TaxID=36176 RepID=UPI001CB7C8DE|nr:synaptobrevin-like protein 5 isoform X2 [Chiloscyllium plagiosum]